MSFRAFPFLIGFMAFSVLTSCAIQESTSQLEDTAFLVFQDVSPGLEFQIDEAPPMSISSSSREVRYEIKPGKHTVSVTRDGHEIVTRLFFLSTGQVFVLRIPGE